MGVVFMASPLHMCFLLHCSLFFSSKVEGSITAGMKLSATMLPTPLLGSTLTVKSDLLSSERATESFLLRQRWQLIQSGIDQQTIKIQGSKLYCNSRLYSQAIYSLTSFVTYPLLSDYLQIILKGFWTNCKPVLKGYNN